MLSKIISLYIIFFFQNKHSSNATKNSSTSSVFQIVNQRSLTLENGITFMNDLFYKDMQLSFQLEVFLISSLTFLILVDDSVSLRHHISKRGLGAVKVIVGIVKIFCFFFCNGNLIY